MDRTRVLLVSSASELRGRVRDSLVAGGVDVWEVDGSARGRASLRRRPLDAVIAGPDVLADPGCEFVSEVRAFDPQIEVVAVVGTPELGRAALAVGAYDFFMEPVDLERLGVVVRHIGEAAEVSERSQAFAQQLEGSASLEDLVARDPRMIEVFERVRRLARYDAPVLLTGDVGVGKESLARALHELGRGGRPFVVVHAADATPAALERACDEARGGTLYVDDVLALPSEVVAGLVALIDRGESEDDSASVRVVAACREEAGPRHGQGTIREDLHLRLRNGIVAVPPLRERREDVVPIAQALLRPRAADAGSPTLEDEAAAVLAAYDWPGNVDELRAVLEAAAAAADGRAIAVGDLPPALRPGPTSPRPPEIEGRKLADIEVACLRKALADARGNKARAARMLGLSRWALQRRLLKHGIATAEPSS